MWCRFYNLFFDFRTRLVELCNNNSGKRLLDHLASSNKDANPELMRFALKLATGAGKTTVMAMLVAWQTINAVRRPNSKNFTRGFLVVSPGLTVKARLRVLRADFRNYRRQQARKNHR